MSKATAEEVEALWVQMRTTSAKLLAMPYKAGRGNEKRYAQAHRQLALAGAVMGLKRKYTGR